MYPREEQAICVWEPGTHNPPHTHRLLLPNHAAVQHLLHLDEALSLIGINLNTDF